MFLIYGSKVGVHREIPTCHSTMVGSSSAWLRCFYLFINYDYVITRIFYIDDLTWADMIMGTVLVTDSCSRRRGVPSASSLPITAMVFLLYGLLIARLEPMRMLDQLYMTTEGIFGIPLAVSAVLS